MHTIARGVTWMRTIFVNVYFVGEPGGPWVLIDTGLPGYGKKIISAAEKRFGEQTAPTAILLTHGHFDHSGSARMLSEYWKVPVYCHPLEMPYLTGKSKFPTPDPTVGGCIAQMSRFMPYGPKQLNGRLRPLHLEETSDGEAATSGLIAELPGWRWIFTPGHSPGHISLFREEDRILIAGDAFATVNMDSYLGMLTWKQELARAGAPYVCDWYAAKNSVAKLAQLKPTVVGAGHGDPMMNLDIEERMLSFAKSFNAPPRGRYVREAAETNQEGIVFLPPKPFDPVPSLALGLGAAAAFWMFRKQQKMPYKENKHAGTRLAPEWARRGSRWQRTSRKSGGVLW